MEEDSVKTLKISDCEDEQRTVRFEDLCENSQISTALPPVSSEILTQYEIKAKVGGGGMGVVYLAKDVKLGRYIALKRLNAKANANPSLRKRFLNEAKAVASLNHIHIVHIYELGEDSEGPYIAMEYVAGPAATTGCRTMGDSPDVPHAPLSLDKQVSENGQYTVNEAVDLIIKIVKAVAYAHARGIIHRDIKPGNILLDASGEPKIVDFGLARVMCENECKLTVPGEKLLSLGYGAPEQESDASVVDERADIYGLGGLLYFAITGQNPRYFREQDIPVSLRDALGKALATDRENRWATAEEFLEALQAVQSRTRVEPPPAKTTWRCKWCDTVNPVTIRFCSECGWEGVDQCPECGGENFIGMQYCGKCGADMRVYESIRNLVAKMQAAVDSDEYEKAVLLASRAQGFEPAGEVGRALAADIRQISDHAQNQLARREKLISVIPLELRAENYERARGFIDEYRKLSGNRQYCAEEYDRINELIVKRDLKSALRDYKSKNWRRTLARCNSLLAEFGPDLPDVAALRKRTLRRIAVNNAIRWTGLVIILFAVYVLSLPVVGYFRDWTPLPASAEVWYAPARKICASESFICSPVSWFASLLGGENGVEKLFQGQGEAQQAPSTDLAVPEDVRKLIEEYAVHIRESDERLRKYTVSWHDPYVGELTQEKEHLRQEGERAAMRKVEDEISFFISSGTIGPDSEDDPPSLSEIKSRYRSSIRQVLIDSARTTVLTTKKYLNALDELIRTFTREDNLALADYLMAERSRTGDSPRFKEAEEIVAAAEAAATSVTTAPAGMSPDEKIGNDMKTIRKRYEEGLAEINDAYNQKLKTWPETYLKALNNLIMSVNKSPKSYEVWAAAGYERERFEIEKTLTQENVSASPKYKELSTVQVSHIALRDSYAREKADAIVKLAEKTCAEFDVVLGKMMQADDAGSAKAVQAEIRRIDTSQEVVQAREFLGNE